MIKPLAIIANGFFYGLNIHPGSPASIYRQSRTRGIMSIGKLDLTTQLKPDISKLRKLGTIIKDIPSRKIYKNFCKLEFAEIMWHPHKFDFITNLGIPYTKISIHSKYFERFYLLREYLLKIFHSNDAIELDQSNISRIEIHSDIEELSLDTVLARLWVMGYRRESVSFYKGNTIYIGSNPKIRIFEKSQQIKRKSLKGKQLSAFESKILESKKSITRFSIETDNFKGTLQNLACNPKQLVSYFDRFKFYDFENDESINRLGGFQILMSKIRREHRKSLEKYKQKDLELLLKKNFVSNFDDWFKEEKQKPFDLSKEIKKGIRQLKEAIEI
ncbi:hypothetical protein NITGR_360035 [Nitrospina gracilis 3/211]|uniref:Uncharacterized protein n=1 Tax=Nitrospina gracilis (strain 3/211) TaxID=1266370 RepID=M1YJQ6_NITG3|nr:MULTISPECIES: hypothetical protein [Nitrospina]MCF8723614.1 hypothetical protein [Nitrospina sp. Nb-3]CCQ90697.1 hypothetical protein NITGR_360035 [Nitrospina gracilis 3/211]